MGLAASQARLFGITARKADCEFKAMELAQQKLEITDQLASIANDYSNAMNTTALMWCDSYGDNYGLTYGILMTPSASNDYNPFFITSPSGAVILNSTYAAAAEAAGIPKSGAIPSQSMRDKFIAALVPTGSITQETANKINVTDYVAKLDPKNSAKIIIETNPDKIVNDADSVEWHSDAGIGREPATNKVVYFVESLMDLVENPNIGQQKVIMRNGKGIAQTFSPTGFKTAGNYATMVKNGFFTSEGKDITLADLLTNEYVYMRDDPVAQVATDMENVLKNIAEVLGYGQIGKGINTDASSDYALTYAYNMVKSVFLSQTNYVKSSGIERNNSSSAEANSLYKDAVLYNRICHWEETVKDENGKKNIVNRTSVNVSAMAAAFLSYYDNALQGTASPYYIGTQSDESTFVTDNPDYQFIVAPNENEVMSQVERLGDFYDELVNNICAKGWREDENIDDYEYLANSLKNGRYQVSTLHDDGQYYQIRYNADTYAQDSQKQTPCISEFKDEDAVARAEIEYSKKKAELTYKEDSIDLKTKSLDSEIAQLNQEYETVKSLVSKNIEKAFTMYSN